MRTGQTQLQKIYQKDNYTFVIEWSDGVMREYRLSELQKECPCAGCVDESTGKRKVDPSHLREDVKAIRISNVGSYALRIQFSSGCSNGIYELDLLRNRNDA
jgi:ATP-binding protein involved in chromosome partitioning